MAKHTLVEIEDRIEFYEDQLEEDAHALSVARRAVDELRHKLDEAAGESTKIKDLNKKTTVMRGVLLGKKTKQVQELRKAADKANAAADKAMDALAEANVHLIQAGDLKAESKKNKDEKKGEEGRKARVAFRQALKYFDSMRREFVSAVEKAEQANEEAKNAAEKVEAASKELEEYVKSMHEAIARDEEKLGTAAKIKEELAGAEKKLKEAEEKEHVTRLTLHEWDKIYNEYYDVLHDDAYVAHYERLVNERGDRGNSMASRLAPRRYCRSAG